MPRGAEVAMDEDFIPRGSIKRFEQKLKASRDDAERKVLMDLLAVERQRLKATRHT
jgi:hypothetical protein